MKASSNFTVITASLLFIVLSQMSPPLAAPPAKEKLTVVTNVSLIAFPPRPSGATETLTVSSPVLVIEDELAAKIENGTALAKMARPSLENLLNNSGRFTVLVEGEAPYKVKATITSLKVTRVQSKKDAAGVAEFLKIGISKLGGNNKFADKFDPKLFDIDVAKDEVAIKVDCGLNLQIMRDNKLIAGHEGRVTREDKTAVIRAELAGVTFSKAASASSGDGPGADVDFPTRLIELAAYDSLNKSIAAIDKEIAERKNAPLETQLNEIKKSAETFAGSAAESQSSSKVKFCGQCGLKLESDDKFCSSCGKAARK